MEYVALAVVSVIGAFVALVVTCVICHFLWK